MERLVSIIIPVFNTGKEAVRVISSLLRGDYQKIEVIVVDDGSHDRSFEFLKGEFGDEKRVKIYHQTNKGASAARNFGLEKATGEIIGFVDSDDEVSSRFVSKMISGMGEGVDLVMTGIKRRGEGRKIEEVYSKDFKAKWSNSREKKEAILRALIQDGKLYPVVNKFFRREIISRGKIRFCTDWSFAEDLRFVLDYIAVMEGEIWFIPESLYIYNYGGEGSLVKETARDWGNWEKSFLYLKKWAGGEFRGLLGLIWLRWRGSWVKAQKVKTKKKSH